MLKHAVRNVLRRFGYEIANSRGLEDYAFGRHLSGLFDKLDIQCVIDVGANCGQYRSFLRDQVGFKGLIVSFEPVSRNIEVLRERAKTDPKWLIQPFALGSVDTRMDINVMKIDQLSSFLDPAHSMLPMFKDRNVVDYRENVAVRRLDSVLAELKATHELRNLYLKVDTQGFDLEVIRGAPSTLARVRGLQTELSVMPIYENSPSYWEMLDELTQRDFAITAMFPVTRDDLMRVIEFDCVMLNSAMCALSAGPVSARKIHHAPRSVRASPASA